MLPFNLCLFVNWQLYLIPVCLFVFLSIGNQRDGHQSHSPIIGQPRNTILFSEYLCKTIWRRKNIYRGFRFRAPFSHFELIERALIDRQRLHCPFGSESAHSKYYTEQRAERTYLESKKRKWKCTNHAIIREYVFGVKLVEKQEKLTIVCRKGEVWFHR